MFRPVSPEHPSDEEVAGVLILRTEGRMHFANARAGDQMWHLINTAKPSVVILACTAIPDIEYTALRMLTDAEEKLSASGVVLYLAALNPETLRLMETAPLGKILGRERMFFNVEQAVASGTALAVADIAESARGVERQQTRSIRNA